MTSNNTLTHPSDDQVCRDAAQTQLQRILANGLFKSSPQHQLILRTIVEESLAGDTDKLKELVLGTQVLKIPDYDSSQNTQVRVVVSRVRKKLKQYFMEAGPEDLIFIEIPLGHYVAKFSPRDAPKREAPTKSVTSYAKYAYALAAIPVGLLAVIVFSKTASRQSNSEWRVRAPIQLTFDGGATKQPAISRDGSTLVYASDRGANGKSAIWIQKQGEIPQQLTDGPGQDITPDISPDGSQVAFRSWRDPAGIWLVSASGGVPILFSKNSYSPRFSPDGSKIAYTKTGADGEEHVFVSDLTGATAERLDFGVNEVGCPIWFPDGRRLVFQARDAGDGGFDYWTAPAHNPASEKARGLGVNEIAASCSGVNCTSIRFRYYVLTVPLSRRVALNLSVCIGPTEPGNRHRLLARAAQSRAVS